MENILAAVIQGVVNHARLSDLALVLVGLFAFCSLAERLTSKGPMHWPVLGIIPTLFFHIRNIYDWATDTTISSGGTFHYRGMWMGGARGILTVDPSIIEYMLKTRFANFPKGRYYRERFSDLLGEGIFNADDNVWREQRRAAAGEMHSSQFAEYSFKTMQELVHNKLLVLLQNFARSEARVDLQDLFLRFTFDNICAAAFGVDPECLALNLPEVPFAKAFENATELTLFRFVVPPFVWKPMRRLGIGSERRLAKAVLVVHEFAKKVVATRSLEQCKFGHLEGRFDLLSRLIESKNYNFSDKFLKDICISFILAGRDTSSVALSWFFWLLDKHQSVEKQILDEIIQIISEREKSTAQRCMTPFTVEELKKMNYLQAALTESLRLYPSVPIDFKEVVEDDVFPDGTLVKKGDRVIYSIFSMARSEAIWGKDCREFKPERWIKEGEFMNESQYKYPVFNAGPRLCVGKKFAYMQMKMVAASILLRYKVSIVEGHEVVPKMSTTLYMKNGLQVTFKPRDLLFSLPVVASADVTTTTTTITTTTC